MKMQPILSAKDVVRFWSRVDRSGSCWVWRRAVPPLRVAHRGYGRYRDHAAHRIAYWLHTGVWPSTLDVCHVCDNPPCCNPAHLFLGTQKDNSADAAAKGRTSRGEHRPAARLTRKQAIEILAIRKAAGRRYGLGRELARRYGVTPSTICDLLAGRSWAWLEERAS